MSSLGSALTIVGALRARYCRMTGGTMTADPKDVIALLSRILAEANVSYAIIGGMAAQVWRREPRTTLDVDIAVLSYDSIPSEALSAAGFRFLARHAHTENWEAPDGSPVQFADDLAFRTAIDSAVSMPLGDTIVRVIRPLEFVRTKLRAYGDEARRRSKRFQDLADAQAVLEEHPLVDEELTPEERELLRGTR